MQDRQTLYHLHLMAKTYSIHPATLLGIDPLKESWLAYQIVRSMWTFGAWVDARREATVSKAVKPAHVPKGMVLGQIPKYSYQQALGLADEASEPETSPEIVAEAAALAAGEIDAAEWLRRG